MRTALHFTTDNGIRGTHDSHFSYDVFLSHNAKDKPRVRRLAERLEQAGLRVWLDEWNVRSGDIISLKVDRGLEQSRVLLPRISPNALASNWVALERRIQPPQN